MPYAIYQLKIQGDVHPDFHSYAKDRASLFADVTKYLYKQIERDNSRFPLKQKQSLLADMDSIATWLTQTEVHVIEELDEMTCKQLDVMLAFLDDLKRTQQQFCVRSNEHIARQLSVTEFGVRKVIAQRMFDGYQTLPFEERQARQEQFNWHFAQVAALEGLIRTEVALTEVTFDRMFKDMTAAVLQSDQVKPLTA